MILRAELHPEFQSEEHEHMTQDEFADAFDDFLTDPSSMRSYMREHADQSRDLVERAFDKGVAGVTALASFVRDLLESDR